MPFSYYPLKRAHIFILLLFFLLLGSTFLMESCARRSLTSLKEHASSTPVLVFGDSLSAGYNMEKDRAWPVLLEKKLRERGLISNSQTVANYSRSGEDTEGGLERLPKALEETRPALVILALGANDALRRQRMEDTKRRLKMMIDMAQQSGAEVVLVGADLPAKMFFVSTRHFTDVYTSIEKEKNVILIPNILEGVNNKNAYMQQDGLHPNAEGQVHILDNIWKGLEKALQ